MRPNLYLCVEYSNGYTLERNLGESVTLRELEGYTNVAQTMMEVTQEVVDIRIEARMGRKNLDDLMTGA